MPSTISHCSQNHTSEPIDLFDFWRQAFRYLVKRVDCVQDAEDLASEAIAKIIAAERRGSGSTDHWSGWAWRIVRNLLIDHYRAQSRGSHYSPDELMASSEKSEHNGGPLTKIVLRTTPFEDATLDRLQIERTLRSVKLTEMQAQAVELVLVQGYKPAEVAQATGKSEGSIKALIHRAKVNLRHTRQPKTIAA